MNDKRAARVVRSVNRRRLDFARQALGEIGFSGDDLDMRAMLFVGYHTWEAPMFPEIPRKRRRELIGKRIALLTRKLGRQIQSAYGIKYVRMRRNLGDVLVSKLLIFDRCHVP